MRKILFIFCFAILFSGCATVRTLEICDNGDWKTKIELLDDKSLVNIYIEDYGVDYRYPVSYDFNFPEDLDDSKTYKIEGYYLESGNISYKYKFDECKYFSGLLENLNYNKEYAEFINKTNSHKIGLFFVVEQTNEHIFYNFGEISIKRHSRLKRELNRLNRRWKKYDEKHYSKYR